MKKKAIVLVIAILLCACLVYAYTIQGDLVVVGTTTTANLAVTGNTTMTEGLDVSGATTTVGLDATGTITTTESVTTEQVLLENDVANHKIYDNSTCTIIEGDTVQMAIC